MSSFHFLASLFKVKYDSYQIIQFNQQGVPNVNMSAVLSYHSGSGGSVHLHFFNGQFILYFKNGHHQVYFMGESVYRESLEY